jgi:AcrR family transcriptional regulator
VISERLATRRTELVAAAVEAIRRLGPSVSMDEMARAAGITKPILYRHFGGKAGLREAIGAQKSAELWQALGPALDPSRPLTAEGLGAAIDGYLAFCEREEVVHLFLHAQDPHHGHHGDEPDDFVDQVVALVAQGFRRRLAEAGADVAAAEPWARGVVGMVMEAADWWQRTRTMTAAELRGHLVTLIWNGFGTVLDAGATGRRTT